MSRTPSADADGVGRIRIGAAALPEKRSAARSPRPRWATTSRASSRMTSARCRRLRDVLFWRNGAGEQGQTACGLYFEQLRPIFREKRPAIFGKTASAACPYFRQQTPWI